MKIKRLIVVSVVGFLLLYVVFPYIHKPMVKPNPDFNLDSSTTQNMIENDYQVNPLAAKDKYVGKLVEFTGKLVQYDIDKDYKNNDKYEAYIVIDDGTGGIDMEVKCFLYTAPDFLGAIPSSASNLTQPIIGDHITVQGRFNSLDYKPGAELVVYLDDLCYYPKTTPLTFDKNVSIGLNSNKIAGIYNDGLDDRLATIDKFNGALCSYVGTIKSIEDTSVTLTGYSTEVGMNVDVECLGLQKDDLLKLRISDTLKIQGKLCMNPDYYAIVQCVADLDSNPNEDCRLNNTYKLQTTLNNCSIVPN